MQALRGRRRRGMLVLALAVVSTTLLSPTAGHSASLSIRAAARLCPDFQDGNSCRLVARSFLSDRQPGSTTDAQILNLANAIADAASGPRVTPVVCRDAARGLRTLADGLQDGTSARQLVSLSRRLCDGVADNARSGNGPVVPQSISSGRVQTRPAGDAAAGDNAVGDDALGDNLGADDAIGQR